MRTRRFYVALLMVSLLLGCAKERGVELNISPNKSNIIELTTKEYTYYELTQIAEYDGNIYQYNSLYPIECMRKLETSFRIAYRGENHISMIYFDDTGEKTLGRIYTASISRASFDDILGCTLDDIMNIDPLGDYTFLYTGRNDNQVSRHCTSDGYMINITYDQSGKATDIAFELI